MYLLDHQIARVLWKEDVKEIQTIEVMGKQNAQGQGVSHLQEVFVVSTTAGPWLNLRMATINRRHTPKDEEDILIQIDLAEVVVLGGVPNG